jgi:multicomponent Na+:H+ antiporter subunit B
MTSSVLTTAARYLAALLLLFSVLLLLRGHNEPGGGFAGGLLASSALALHAVAYGPDATLRTLKVEPGTLLGIGLLVMLAFAVLPLAFGRALLTSRWVALGGFEVGTPMGFEVGVYLVVLGAAASIVLRLEAE